VPAVCDPRELPRAAPSALEAHPLLGLRAEPLGGGERNVLRRALGLREDAVPQRSRWPLDGGHVAHGVSYMRFLMWNVRSE
jgi:hypothetical protein